MTTTPARGGTMHGCEPAASAVVWEQDQQNHKRERVNIGLLRMHVYMLEPHGAAWWRVTWIGTQKSGPAPSLDAAKAAALECARRVLTDALAMLGSP